MLQTGRPGATGTDSYQDWLLEEATLMLAISQGATEEAPLVLGTGEDGADHVRRVTCGIRQR